jgi:hypothetical protein
MRFRKRAPQAKHNRYVRKNLSFDESTVNDGKWGARQVRREIGVRRLSFSEYVARLISQDVANRRNNALKPA